MYALRTGCDAQKRAHYKQADGHCQYPSMSSCTCVSHNKLLHYSPLSLLCHQNDAGRQCL
ncbi:hypothetical protein BT69DRAFT_1288507, partial [Atractiella rhizophila]